jgi:nitronate monooxygenase
MLVLLAALAAIVITATLGQWQLRRAEHKQALVDAAAGDIVYTPYFTGVHGNYLKQSIVAAGLDPANLPARDKSAMDFGAAAADSNGAKAWKDIWGAGQGVGAIDDISPAAEVVDRLHAEYRAARAALCSTRF